MQNIGKITQTINIQKKEMNIPVINIIEEHTTLDNKIIIESNKEKLIQIIKNNNNIQK